MSQLFSGAIVSRDKFGPFVDKEKYSQDDATEFSELDEVRSLGAATKCAYYASIQSKATGIIAKPSHMSSARNLGGTPSSLGHGDTFTTKIANFNRLVRSVVQ